MKTGQIISIILLIILMNCATTLAKMYRYVDENGVVTFQDRPPQNIPQGVEVETLPTVQSQDSGDDTSINDATDNAVKSEKVIPAKKDKKEGPKDIYKNARVELYVTSWCKYCKMAKQYLRSKGVSFVEYDIEKDKAAAQRKKRLDSRNGVPFAIINDKKIHGFSKRAYMNALRSQ